MTECNQKEFAFAPHFSQQVSARFSERQLSTEGGALLLRETDGKIGLLARVSKCFSDYRHPGLIEHALGELLAQRIYGLALGYEDLNDHEELDATCYWPSWQANESCKNRWQARAR